MKLVAAIKMLPTPKQAVCLIATLKRCNAACSWLAERGFESQTFRQYDLHKMAYAEIRERFGLTAQAAVRSIAKVSDAFKVNSEVAPAFRPDAAQPYDDRIIRFVKDGSAVSLWTIEGRMVIPIVMGEHQKRLMAFRKGEVDLCFVRGKWMLAATCDVPETTEFQAEDWLGVDLGIVSLAVTSDGKSCPKCGSTERHHIRPGRPSGDCKNCHRLNEAVRKARNPEVYRKRKAEIYVLNAERERARSSAKAANNPEWNAAATRADYRKHAVKRRAWHRGYYTRNQAAFIARQAVRAAIKLRACPTWSDKKAIATIYAEAKKITEETGIVHHVDHIVPLQGKNVCGLHVSWNLRIIPGADNLAKSNKLLALMG